MGGKRALQRFVARMVAAAGGDPAAVRIPDTKDDLNCLVQVLGGRYVLIASVKDQVRRQQAPRIADLMDDGLSETLVRGHVVCVEDDVWLMMNTGWQLPLIAPTEYPYLDAVLQLIDGEVISLWGILSDSGLVITRFTDDSKRTLRR
jgi:hypothetical protein